MLLKYKDSNYIETNCNMHYDQRIESYNNNNNKTTAALWDACCYQQHVTSTWSVSLHKKNN